MPPIRVLVVDDHPVVRRGLHSMLAGAEGVEVVGEASSAAEAIEQVAALCPHVLLLDIRMPGMDGFQLTYFLKHKFPDLRVIILTAYSDEQFLLQAFRVGADGYLLKNVSLEKLLEALHTVCEGKRILSEELIDSVLKQFGELSKRQVIRELGLLDSEIDLLAMVAEGATNRQIAERLYWSEATVKRKLSDIFRKLGVSDRTQAVAVAMRHGLLR